MERTLLISDIHGSLDKLEALLGEVGYDPSQDQLILLGDYIDRGPDSKGVVNKVIELTAGAAVALKGNHEEMMEKAFQEKGRINHWLRNGGLETLESYGAECSDWTDPDVVSETLQELAKTDIVASHLAFIEKLDHYIENDEYIFVHGGVDPQTPIADTDPHLLLWIRDEFHSGYKGDKTVVFGHTPTYGLHQCHDVYFGNNKIIGIDGGCVYGGQLNCLELPTKKVYSL